MSEYLQNLRDAVAALHGCDCSHAGTSRVVEFFEDRKVFDGNVETFSLSGHPKAPYAFAWAFDSVDDIQYVAVLAVAPILSPSDAVRASIASGDFHP